MRIIKYFNKIRVKWRMRNKNCLCFDNSQNTLVHRRVLDSRPLQFGMTGVSQSHSGLVNCPTRAARLHQPLRILHTETFFIRVGHSWTFLSKSMPKLQDRIYLFLFSWCTSVLLLLLLLLLFFIFKSH
jgi:hypothetical protein